MGELLPSNTCYEMASTTGTREQHRVVGKKIWVGQAMNKYKLRTGGHILTITGFSHNQRVRTRHLNLPHTGHTVELTITAYDGSQKCFNVPHPITGPKLGQIFAWNGIIALPGSTKIICRTIDAFVKELKTEHGLHRAYKPFPNGMVDCVVQLGGVQAESALGHAEADQFVTSWFP